MTPGVGGMTQIQHYRALLRQARRAARRPDEAEDLLQTALLLAVMAGRGDLSCAGNRAWIGGVLRNRAMFDARTAARRRRREATASGIAAAGTAPDAPPPTFLRLLSPALRTTAMLALCGQTRGEIAWLLRLSDATLRQRIAAIRRRWLDWCRQHDHTPGDTTRSALAGNLRFGAIRQSLRRPLAQAAGSLASHDPDGHLFVLSSQNRPTRQQVNVQTTTRK